MHRHSTPRNRPRPPPPHRTAQCALCVVFAITRMSVGAAMVPRPLKPGGLRIDVRGCWRDLVIPELNDTSDGTVPAGGLWMCHAVGGGGGRVYLHLRMYAACLPAEAQRGYSHCHCFCALSLP